MEPTPFLEFPERAPSLTEVLMRHVLAMELLCERIEDLVEQNAILLDLIAPDVYE